MNNRHDFREAENHRRIVESGDGQAKGSKKIAGAAKAIRAVTAVVVFGIPLVTGTATLLGYGVYKAYKRMTGHP